MSRDRVYYRYVDIIQYVISHSLLWVIRPEYVSSLDWVSKFIGYIKFAEWYCLCIRRSKRRRCLNSNGVCSTRCSITVGLTPATPRDHQSLWLLISPADSHKIEKNRAFSRNGTGSPIMFFKERDLQYQLEQRFLTGVLTSRPPRS